MAKNDIKDAQIAALWIQRKMDITERNLAITARIATIILRIAVNIFPTKICLFGLSDGYAANRALNYS
jgi:hypothetical protein